MWALRAKLGQKPTDKLVFTTWKRLKPVSGQLGKPKFYVDTIIAAAEEMKLQLDEQFIRQVFAERNLK